MKPDRNAQRFLHLLDHGIVSPRLFGSGRDRAVGWAYGVNIDRSEGTDSQSMHIKITKKMNHFFHGVRRNGSGDLNPFHKFSILIANGTDKLSTPRFDAAI